VGGQEHGRNTDAPRLVLLLDSAVVAVVLARMVRIAAVSTAIAIASASAITVSLVVVMSVLLLTC
jgi:hypothetical protein